MSSLIDIQSYLNKFAADSALERLHRVSLWTQCSIDEILHSVPIHYFPTVEVLFALFSDLYISNFLFDCLSFVFGEDEKYYHT